LRALRLSEKQAEKSNEPVRSPPEVFLGGISIAILRLRDPNSGIIIHALSHPKLANRGRMSIRYSFSLIVLASALAFAQTPSTGKSAVYLDQQSPFTPDFTAALMAKSVPVVVTTDPANARYAVTFTLERNNGSIFQGITSAINSGSYNPGGFDRATMQVVDNQTKTVTYSYTCKKDSTNSSDPMKSAAECLAKHWKSNLQK
jgi:hypothetical protein